MSITVIDPWGNMSQPTNEDRTKIGLNGDSSGILPYLQQNIKGEDQTRGFIEIVQLARSSSQPRMQMIVNEEGLLINLPYNHFGTLLYTALCGGRNNTPIAGTIVILTGDDCLD